MIERNTERADEIDENQIENLTKTSAYAFVCCHRIDGPNLLLCVRARNTEENEKSGAHVKINKIYRKYKR